MNRTAAQILEAFLEVPNHPLKIIPIGIIDDFHSTSLHDPVKPTVIVMEENMRYANLLVKVKAGSEAHVLKAVNDIWKRLFLVSPIGINWLDDMVQQQYVKEQKQQTLFALFRGLALFLAALGVFGLIVHATEQRVKEIGVRKVLGASVTGIVKMLSGDFVKLVFIAILIASPIAWWAMDNWLQDFAYRIDMEWWMFALAGMVAVAIALLTVSFQAVKAALANPVDSLRDEQGEPLGIRF
jgi:putative ABC transport system permease protein